VIAPEWDGQVRGIAYNPSHVFDQEDNKSIPYEQIDTTCATGADHRPCPHLYGRAWHGQVPEIAARYGLTVSLGIWISAESRLE